MAKSLNYNIFRNLSTAYGLFLALCLFLVTPFAAFAADASASSSKNKNKDKDKQFVVVLDAGHGGKDIGATDNGAREKDINLSVALKVGELVKKKLKGTKVIFTRDDDTFVSLQGRADIANSNKADLFISIHTNSVDKSNKNRTSVCGSSVYALGLHKDDNNKNVARRENSVIELEGDYEQKYSGFDPAKDESYIIFEMAQKKNLAKSIKFANEVQKNLVKYADRRDRGVHQAGFWVLWATSMPSVLIELDFICNPESAKYMTSKAGVDKLAESIFEAIKDYENKYISQKTALRQNRSVDEIMADSRNSGLIEDRPAPKTEPITASRRQRVAGGTGSQSSLSKGGNYGFSARKRRSHQAAEASSQRDYDKGGEIVLFYESDGFQSADESLLAKADENDAAPKTDEKAIKKEKKSKKTKRAKPVRHNAYDFKTVYTIQILASDKRLGGGDPDFHGLSPVYAFRENNKYKYTYGEADTREELLPQLKEIRKMIPDATIIAKTRSNQKNKSK